MLRPRDFSKVFYGVGVLLIGVFIFFSYLSKNYSAALAGCASLLFFLASSFTRQKRVKVLQSTLGRALDELKCTEKRLERSRNVIKGKNKKLRSNIKKLREENSNLSKKENNMKSILQDLQIEKKKLESSMVRDDAILDSMGDGMVVTDENRRITFVNAAAEDILGWKLPNLLGKIWPEVLPARNKFGRKLSKRKLPSFQAVETNRKVASNTYSDLYLTCKDKSLTPVALTATPIHSDGDELTGVVVVFRNVSQEKEIDRMKTEFISLASHQLRTPLSTMKWYCELLLNGDVGSLSEDQADYVKSIAQSNDRMIGLVTDLLNVSKLESGRMSVSLEKVELGALISTVIKDLSAAKKGKKLKIVTSINPRLGKVLIDEKLIREVYHNLISNAIKYSDFGGEINVIVSRKDNNVIAQVSDAGLGIPKSDQKKVFEKFFRSDIAVLNDTNGNGLGLYIVKAIVENFGGKVWFLSEEGQGSTFWFSLPIKT